MRGSGGDLHLHYVPSGAGPPRHDQRHQPIIQNVAEGSTFQSANEEGRPRARVPLVVWAWDLVVIRLLCCGLPAPARRQFFALRFVTVCH